MREIGTARIEAFSDGVFAIAATLLVLQIGVGSARGGRLGSELVHIWPSYLAYVTSFVTTGTGLPSYLVVFVLAFFSPLAAVILTFALAAFYLPSATLFAQR